MDPEDIMAARYVISHKIHHLSPEIGTDTDTPSVDRELTIFSGRITMCLWGGITLYSVRQHNHFITQGNCKATCFDCRLVIFRYIFVICVTM